MLLNKMFISFLSPDTFWIKTPSKQNLIDLIDFIDFMVITAVLHSTYNLATNECNWVNFSVVILLNQ